MNPSVMAPSPSPPPQPPIVLITYVYGPNAFKTSLMRLFLKSAAGCGADMVMLSMLNASAKAAGVVLPRNVRAKHFEWAALPSLLHRRFFAGAAGATVDSVAAAFGKSGPYKLHDIKPLLPMLFPGLVKGYSWWGWLDWDVWLGDLRRLGTFLRTYPGDVWSPGLNVWKLWLLPSRCRHARRTTSNSNGGPQETTHGDWDSDCYQRLSLGPLTIVRNTPSYRRVWEEADALRRVRTMLQSTHMGFDEWSSLDGIKVQPERYASSFTGIMVRAHWSGALRLSLGPADKTSTLHAALESHAITRR